MDYLIGALIFALLVQLVFRPTLKYLAYRRWEEYVLWEKVYKLRVIRGFYPQFKNVSYDEIEKTYGIDNLYHSAGKLYLRHSQ